MVYFFPFCLVCISLIDIVASLGSLDTDLSQQLDILSEFPVRSLLDENVCGEEVWCKDSHKLQKRIYDWQNPGPEKCKTAKFLVHSPKNIGIGAMIHMTVDAMNIAMNTGRILYFRKNVQLPWQSEGCKRESLDCYFLPMTSCELDESKLNNIPSWNDQTWKGLVASGAPIARLDFSKHGRPVGPALWCRHQGADGHLPAWFLEGIASKDAFLIEGVTMAQFVRYMLRPQDWFRKSIKHRLHTAHRAHNMTLPKPFASVHVRYGDKAREAPRHSLSQYMSLLRTKRPDIKTVFVSTETESVISDLRNGFPGYNFQYFKYHRIEAHASWAATDKQEEFTMSIINLLVALHADVSTTVISLCYMNGLTDC